MCIVQCLVFHASATQTFHKLGSIKYFSSLLPPTDRETVRLSDNKAIQILLSIWLSKDASLQDTQTFLSAILLQVFLHFSCQLWGRL